MSPLLDDAIAKARTLPDKDQDAIAAIILEEIADDQRWEDSFARSSDVLKRLADQADEEVKAGRYRAVGFDDL